MIVRCHTNAQERTAKAEALKQEGNSLYAEGRHAEAQVRWHVLHCKVPVYTTACSGSTPVEDMSASLASRFRLAATTLVRVSGSAHCIDTDLPCNRQSTARRWMPRPLQRRSARCTLRTAPRPP
jgi:hypothetical protein